MKKKRTKLDDQIRQAIQESGLTLYAISERTGINYAALHRFVHRKVDARISSVDKLAELLGLTLTKREE